MIVRWIVASELSSIVTKYVEHSEHRIIGSAFKPELHRNSVKPSTQSEENNMYNSRIKTARNRSFSVALVRDKSANRCNAGGVRNTERLEEDQRESCWLRTLSRPVEIISVCVLDAHTRQ